MSSSSIFAVNETERSRLTFKKRLLTSNYSSVPEIYPRLVVKAARMPFAYAAFCLVTLLPQMVHFDKTARHLFGSSVAPQRPAVLRHTIRCAPAHRMALPGLQGITMTLQMGKWLSQSCRSKNASAHTKERRSRVSSGRCADGVGRASRATRQPTNTYTFLRLHWKEGSRKYVGMEEGR